MLQSIKEYLQNNGIDYLCNVSMREKTWIHRGPVVPFYIIPKTSVEFELIIRYLFSTNVHFKVVGYTSNIYMLESLKIEAIVTTIKLNDYIIEDDVLKCETGVCVSKMSKICINNGFKGFEGLVDLPGTIGSAVVNNSSCFNCSLSSLLYSATILEYNNGIIEKKQVDKEYFNFCHRNSAIKSGQKNTIILSITLSLCKVKDISYLQEIADINSKRRKKEQEGPWQNLGSVYSSRKLRPFNFFSFGFLKSPLVIAYKVINRYFSKQSFVSPIKIRILFKLYDYEDIIPYVSRKNINCFIWKDQSADSMFLRYDEFMNRCYICNREIEILK